MTSVLDHGEVSLIETWGSEEGIISSARMSTDGAFRGWGTKDKPGDEKLLRYLWRNKHSTPFEMAGATFELKAPIFVVREIQRHRTFSYNEMSARYIPLPAEDYVPSITRLMTNSEGTNKQAGRADGAEKLTELEARSWRQDLIAAQQRVQRLYAVGLVVGIPKELARVALPVARYSKLRMSGNLRNWCHFLKLREADNAQYEIRVYANEIHRMLGEKFPRTMELFEEDAK